MLRDIWLSGVLPRDLATWKSEALVDHRTKARQFLPRFIPSDSVGAELGVFTGLFSALLARQTKIKSVAFVDPWWLAFGEHYPSWGGYTANGTLSTRAAQQIAADRIARSGLSGRRIEVAFSYDWLDAQPDESLDWVYLDSTHTYQGTRAELELLNMKIKRNGVILGDDWQQDRNHRHHGVCRAINEFVKISDFEIAFSGVSSQWMLRRSNSQDIATSMLVQDLLHPRGRVPESGNAGLPDA